MGAAAALAGDGGVVKPGARLAPGPGSVPVAGPGYAVLAGPGYVAAGAALAAGAANMPAGERRSKPGSMVCMGARDGDEFERKVGTAYPPASSSPASWPRKPRRRGGSPATSVSDFSSL